MSDLHCPFFRPDGTETGGCTRIFRPCDDCGDAPARRDGLSRAVGIAVDVLLVVLCLTNVVASTYFFDHSVSSLVCVVMTAFVSGGVVTSVMLRPARRRRR